jgi:hypothetical protein
MDIQYHALRILFEERLFYAPIDKNPQCILDIGTGTGESPRKLFMVNWLNSSTGIWVMDVGEHEITSHVAMCCC